MNRRNNGPGDATTDPAAIVVEPPPAAPTEAPAGPPLGQALADLAARVDSLEKGLTSSPP